MAKKREKYLIRAKVREMAAGEITGHIGNDRYQAIKHTDDHPFFFGATVAHSGISTGEIQGQGSQEKHWPAAAIASLTRQINESAAPVFLGHGGDNRQSFGAVISAFSEDGKAQAVSYIQDSDGKNQELANRIREGELNTVSIEADLVLQVEENGSLTVMQVEQVTGLALGDSRWERPGFEGARVLASVQEFEKDDDNEPDKQEETEVKLSEIIAAIRENGHRPEQVFQNDELLAAQPVKDALSEAQQATEAAKTEAKTAAEEKEKLAKTAEELTGKLSGYESAGLVAEQIKAAKLTEKAAQYVEKQLEGYTPQGETDEARQEAVGAAIKQHTETFNQFFKGGKGDETPSGGGGGSEEPEDPEDMTDPGVNSFLPGSTVKAE